MPREKFPITPLDGGLFYDAASLEAPPNMMLYPSKNVRIDRHRANKRWGYAAADRSLGSGVTVDTICIYQEKDTTQNTIYLTDTNACLKQAAGTFSYITETYTTGTVTGITNKVVTGSGTTWKPATNPVEVGDLFIMDDDHSANDEIDANWNVIATVTSDTSITLTDAYTKNGTDYKIRKLYSVPTGEKWWWATVDDIFCFGNGNVNVQKFEATSDTYASSLDTTYAVKARYGIEYANRLVIADYGSTRDPLSIRWSNEGDPETWTGTTAGTATMLESGDFITGLGKIGVMMVVYQREGMIIATRSGVSTAPINFSKPRVGIGLLAPYSLIQAFGTNYFLSRNNFYKMVADQPVPIGDDIWGFFDDEVTLTNKEKVWGFAIEPANEIHFIATTTTYSQLDFVYNIKYNRWYVYDFLATLKGAGRGVST
jgi:hypothetical protein